MTNCQDIQRDLEWLQEMQRRLGMALQSEKIDEAEKIRSEIKKDLPEIWKPIDAYQLHWRERVATEHDYDFVDVPVEGLAMVNAGKDVFFVDSDGVPISEDRYLRAERFSEGCACVYTEAGTFFIDRQGLPLFKNWFDGANSFHEGRTWVMKDKEFFFIDHSGQPISDKKYRDVSDFTNGFAVVRDRDGHVHIDQQGREISSERYQACGLFSGEGLAWVKLNDKYSFIDGGGQRLTAEWYDEPIHFYNGVAMVKKNGFYHFIDRTGQPTSDRKFGYGAVSEFSEGFAGVFYGGEFKGRQDEWRHSFFIDQSGEPVFGKKFDMVGEFHDGRAAVEIGKRKFFIDQTGKRLSQAWYDDVVDFNEGLARVKRGKKYFFIDRAGQPISDERYDGATVAFKGGLVWVSQGKEAFFINRKGRKVFPLQKGASFTSF
ncbi:WG repeat-containing protein [Patescibacteria group bacterium]|nr:MAG: WG repeat-containing protein [Patescibacteria group bacterium]